MAVKQNNSDGGAEPSSSSSAQNGNKSTTQKEIYDLSSILYFINYITTEHQGVLPKGTPKALCELLVILSKIPVPRDPKELKLFKEGLFKVGDFLKEIGEQDQPFVYCRNIYWQCLEIVCNLIAAEETPSCAITIVFQLFEDELIPKAVSLVLSNNENANDEVVRRTVNILCTWLHSCNFCQNLDIWIISILKELREHHKYDLLYNIAMDVIEPLFRALIIPVLRPKVAPVVFYILSSVKHTSDVFHKIVGQAPKVINQIKNENSNPEGKKILQTMVDVLSALMTQFQGYDEPYKKLEEVLSEYTTSYDYHTVLNYPSWCSPDDIISTNPKMGLVNLGNTCYMNSVLQALAMTKEFSREILLSRCKSPILSKIQQLFALILHSYRPELTPSTVLHATRPPSFIPGLQQDSSEFLGYLLEMLHEREAEYVNNFDSPTIETNKLCNEVMDYTEDGAAGCNYKSITSGHSSTMKAGHKSTIIENTFAGKIITTSKCSTCGWESKKVDNFRDLQLAFSEASTNYSVQDLLDYYCSSEKLDGDNQYFCEKCKRLTDAERFINVVKAPKNLILTLKYFKYDQIFHKRAKLMHKVFHDENVSLKVYCPETLREIATFNYNLYAVVVHSGYSMDSGHYYTYASDTTDKWYKFNDNIVSQCNISELRNLKAPNTPYILFYQMNSRLIETSSNSANKIVRVEAPLLPSFEDLPLHLREYINRDNSSFKEEARIRKNLPSTSISLKNKNDGGNGNNDDDPPSACGANALNYFNRFIC